MGPKTPRRHKSGRVRPDHPAARHVTESWSIDFTSDELFNGRRLRFITIVDDLSRESLALEVSQRHTGHDVAGAFTRPGSERGLSRTMRAYNGPEIISKALDQWA
ncbi:MAG: hypothetical protein AMXMBFR16_12060 [Candidatus Uhrbacteria bacterium]